MFLRKKATSGGLRVGPLTLRGRLYRVVSRGHVGHCNRRQYEPSCGPSHEELRGMYALLRLSCIRDLETCRLPE